MIIEAHRGYSPNKNVFRRKERDDIMKGICILVPFKNQAPLNI